MRFYALALLPVVLIGISSGLQPILPSFNKLNSRPTQVQPILPSSKLYTGLTQVTELLREPALKEYVHEFVIKTNDGRVFTLDISMLNSTQESVRKKLTPEEIRERQEWKKARSALVEHFSASRKWTDLTPSELLLLRVAPPLLSDLVVFERSGFDTKRERTCPDKVYAWEDFADEVRSFTVQTAAGETTVVRDALYHSLKNRDELRFGGESTHVFHEVLVRLRAAGLLEHGPRDDALVLLKPPPVLCEASHFLWVGGNKTVPIEFKETHNLLVPEKASEVIRRYNKAVEEVKETQVCTVDWINIGHPLAQVINYMFVGQSRYGVLSSATRTYFFKVEETASDPRVFITDAWFIGQEDYLRAWSYLYHLGTVNGDFHVPSGLEKKWQTWTLAGRRKEVGDGADDSTDGPHLTSRKSDDHDGGLTDLLTERLMTWLDPGIAPSIPRVNGEDIEFVGILGVEGDEPYLAIWKGMKVAVKVFDVYKAMTCFENEIRGYEHLKDAWGVLVPEPYFIADRFGLVLLGMQLGRIPSRSDREFKSERGMLFDTLEREYGFFLSDEDDWDEDWDEDRDGGRDEDWRGDVIYIPDRSGTGPDRLAAFDLDIFRLGGS